MRGRYSIHNNCDADFKSKFSLFGKNLAPGLPARHTNTLDGTGQQMYTQATYLRRRVQNQSPPIAGLSPKRRATPMPTGPGYVSTTEPLAFLATWRAVGHPPCHVRISQRAIDFWPLNDHSVRWMGFPVVCFLRDFRSSLKLELIAPLGKTRRLSNRNFQRSGIGDGHF